MMNHAAGPDLPPAERTALLLDLDGTLLDIAPRPDAVTVAPGLADALRRLRDRLGGALGAITGRPIDQADGLFAGLFTSVAGEHGGAFRHGLDGALLRPDLPAIPPAWIATAEALVAAHPGTLLERKARGFVLHYRAAPEAGPAMRSGLEAMLAEQAGAFSVMPAHMAWELKPSAADKGTALGALMRQAPFLGRLPVFVGDDVTDMDAIHAARRMGGVGLFVPDVFGGPAEVRTWLARLAGLGEGGVACAGW